MDAETRVEIKHLKGGLREHDLTIDALKESTIRTEEHMKTFVTDNRTMLEAIHKQGERQDSTETRVTALETFKYGAVIAWGMIIGGATVIWQFVKNFLLN